MAYGSLYEGVAGFARIQVVDLISAESSESD